MKARGLAFGAPIWRSHLRSPVLVFAACFIGGRIGLAVPFTSGNVSPAWPPAGIALASLLLLGFRVWPGIALAAFLVNLLTPIPHVAAAGTAVGNTVAPVLGAWLLRRVPGFRPSLARLRDVLAFVVIAVFCATAASATLGTLALFASGVNAWSHFGSAWLMWWLGDAMGVLVVAPLVLAMPSLVAIREWRRRLELLALLAGTILICALVFRSGSEADHDVMILALFPFVVWGALRLETPGAAMVSFLMGAMTVWATAHGLGPFVHGTSLQNAMLMQSFLAVIAVSGLSMAALITERTRLIREAAEREAVRQGEERYRAITETANEGVWMLDSQLLTCFVNARMTEMLGYSADEMMGKPVVEFMFQEDRERKRAELERRKHGVNAQIEDRYRRKDGSELWVRLSTTGSFDRNGRFSGALAMVSDISAERRSEAEHRSARSKILLLSRAVEQTADSVVVTDKRGVIEYVNPAFERTTGYLSTEAVGRTPAILKSGQHDQAFYREMWDQILRGEPFEGLLVNRKKLGDIYWAQQTITPIRDDAGEITHFVSVLKDVTELRRQHEQEVQLRLAHEVQQRLYAMPIALPGLDLAAACIPANETGGDYFDFISASSDSVYVAVGDASGHGLASAIVIALTRAYVRSFAAMNLDVGEILTHVNRMLKSDLEDNWFVTLLLARIDARTRVLSYANAGHVPGFVLNGGAGVVSKLGSTGVPMGVLAPSKYASCDVRLDPGQIVLFVTDGVTESTDIDDEQFGERRTIDYACTHRDRSARQIADGICQAALDFAGSVPQLDDLTSVIVKLQ